jgi:hypothetical protein
MLKSACIAYFSLEKLLLSQHQLCTGSRASVSVDGLTSRSANRTVSQRDRIEGSPYSSKTTVATFILNSLSV